jgi:metallo-beta-lactamase family protein
MESTYGNRSHGGTPDYVAELVKVFERTFARGGNVVIPSFAVGRTQELLYFIRKIKADKLIDREFDVYMDSPLAIEATNVYNDNINACFDEEAMELVRNGINPLMFDGLKFAVSSEESKMINFDNKPKVIISASGMCEAGRIKHHLKHNLWRPECTILFAGYQAVGTTGRVIVDGVKELKLFGEPISVSAEIAQLPGASGHADKEGLLNWINSFTTKPERVFVVHGEDTVCEEFKDCLIQEYGFQAVAPYTGGVFDLATGNFIAEGNREKIEKVKASATGRRGYEMFDRLMAAGKRLLTVIGHNEGSSNKDLGKFTDQINALCDKWDR